MSSDLYVSYIKEPDSEFFEMRGRREFAIENNEPIPDNVEDYFRSNDSCTSGIRIRIPVIEYYDDPDYLTVTFKVEDIPEDVKTIIVEYG